MPYMYEGRPLTPREIAAREKRKKVAKQLGVPALIILIAAIIANAPNVALIAVGVLGLTTIFYVANDA